MNDFYLYDNGALVDFALDSYKVSGLDAEEKQTLIRELANRLYDEGYGSDHSGRLAT